MESSSLDHLGHRISWCKIHAIWSRFTKRDYNWSPTIHTHHVYCKTLMSLVKATGDHYGNL